MRDHEAHLRVGGGTGVSLENTYSCEGASPRGRRNRDYELRITPDDGRISAWAEEPPRKRLGALMSQAHLRVGGGTKTCRAGCQKRAGASPRGRRNPESEAEAERLRGRISAWAEEPDPRRGCG